MEGLDVMSEEDAIQAHWTKIKRTQRVGTLIDALNESVRHYVEAFDPEKSAWGYKPHTVGISKWSSRWCRNICVVSVLAGAEEKSAGMTHYRRLALEPEPQ